MTIKIGFGSNRFQASSIEGSEKFEEHRGILCSLPGRNAVYQEEDFSYWDLPRHALKVLMPQISLSDLQMSPEAETIICDYYQNIKPIDELPQEELVIEPVNGRTPYVHQENYIRIPKFKRAILCSFATGIGKTFTTLLRARAVGFVRMLVICPRNLLKNWETEIWETYGEQALIYTGTVSQRKKLESRIAEAPIIVTNYEKMRELNKILAGVKVDHCIIDEIHNVCNWSTVIHQEIYKFLNDTHLPIRQGLSATPLRLRLEDLWGVLRLLDPEFSGTQTGFMSKYEKITGYATHRYKDKQGILRERKVPVVVSTVNESNLRGELRSILVRVKKDGIVNFKDTIDIITTELKPKQAKLYEEVRTQLLIDLESGELRIQNALTRMLRLLQAAEGAFNLDPKLLDSGKLDFLFEELDRAGDKVIVWSRFLPITRLLYERYKDRAVLYNGEVSDGLKNLGVWAFQGVTNQKDAKEYERLSKYHKEFGFDPGGAQFFFGTVHLKSGLGINLQSANRCFFSSYDFNPHANIQAKDRIARIGQQADEVLTTFLVSERTLENKALKLILNHYQQALKVLDGAGDLDYKTTKQIISLLDE